MNKSERLALTGFRLGWWAGRALPESFFRSFFDVIARVMWWRGGAATKRLTFNISRVLGVNPTDPQAREIAQRALRSYFRYWCELFRMQALSSEQIMERSIEFGTAQVDAALKSGRGVMIAATHSGNWDHAGAWAARRFGSLTSVAERLRPEELFDRFVAAREQLSMEILPHRGGDRPAFDILSDRLNDGRLIALAADRDLSRGGIPVTFFGHATKFPAGPAKLAIETGCLLLPTGVYFEGKKSGMHFYAPISTTGRTVEEVTQDLAAAFEVIIRAHPENWHMLQQLWLDHPVEWGGRAK